MRLFKRHKTNKDTVSQLGITECRICQNNIRCEECIYPSENEALKTEVERLNNTIYTFEKHFEFAKAEAVKEYKEKLYRFLCDRENWDAFKREWLENGECYWLKQKLNTVENEMVSGD